VCRISGPLTEGSGPTSRLGSFPAPRFACHCSPVGFDRQQWYTSLIEPVARSFASSFLMASLLSGAKHHSRCFFGVALGSTFRQCSISSLGTPGISAGFHTNMSRLALRKLTSAHSYLSPKLPPIKAVLDGSPSCNWMALMLMSLGLGLTLDWLGRWLEISISELVSFCVAASTSADGFGRRDVVTYSIASWS
jgi:hypothetical protein